MNLLGIIAPTVCCLLSVIVAPIWFKVIYLLDQLDQEIQDYMHRQVILYIYDIPLRKNLANNNICISTPPTYDDWGPTYDG